MSNPPFVIVEKGAPYEKGTSVSLKKHNILIGRATTAFHPDISFENLLISRNHCSLECHGGDWVLCDMGSKHGTTLNDKTLKPLCPHPVRNGDRISLASAVAVLRFLESREGDRTMSNTISQLVANSRCAGSSDDPITVDEDKMELLINGRKIALSVKEWQLMALLYNNRNKVVSYEEIKTVVWFERNLDYNQVPDVSPEEINILVYRLRKKMGKYDKLLRTVRGRGCVLEI